MSSIHGWRTPIVHCCLAGIVDTLFAGFRHHLEGERPYPEYNFLPVRESLMENVLRHYACLIAQPPASMQ